MNGLDVVRMIVPPRSSHTPRINVVRNDVVIVRELPLAEGARTVLSDNFPIQELPHFSIRPDFPVSTWMLGIFDSSDAHLKRSLSLRDSFPATAKTRSMDRANLVAAESHDFSPRCY